MGSGGLQNGVAPHSLHRMTVLDFEYAPALKVPDSFDPGRDLTICVRRGDLIVPEPGRIWHSGMHHLVENQRVQIGRLNGRLLRCVDVPDVPEGWSSLGLRDYLLNSDEQSFRVAGLSVQIMNWFRQQNFCPQCGNALEFTENDRALQCAYCQYRDYPRVNPCVIVSIRRGDEVLLAQSHRMRSTGIYSCLAGFVEAGESLEEAIVREVREEAGVDVGDIRYVGSQAWPFPHQLMLGFVADYRSGELQPDTREIADLGWYRADCLPKIPPHQTIARQLIDQALRSD